MRLSLGVKKGLRGEYILSLLLLFNAFYWYFIAQNLISKIASYTNNYYLEMFFPISIIISSLVSSFAFPKVYKIRFLKLWMCIGAAMSLLPLLTFKNPLIDIVVVITLGASLGAGMPSLLSFFVESIPVENRGKIGGLTFFMATVCAPLFLLTRGTLDVEFNTFVLTSWRIWGVLAIIIFSKRSSHLVMNKSSDKRQISFGSLFTNRTFTYYLIAWLLFSLVDGVESSLWYVFSLETIEFTSVRDIVMVEAPIAGFSALVGGVLADWWGRKKIILFGFVSLGAAYALIGMTSIVGSIPYFLWLIFYATDGLAIGLLWSMFTIVIWGEISRCNIEKHYAVGEIPYFLTQLVFLTLTPYMTDFVTGARALEDGYLDLMRGTFSLAAFFLFVAVIPLLFVDETLPKRKIEERQLRTYTEEAIKLKQKVIQK